VGDDNRVVSGQKFPGEKENVRLSVVVMQQSVFCRQISWRSLHIFSRSRAKLRSKIVVPVLNQLSTTPLRRMEEWIYRSVFS
jgi:hypothetical protein